MAKGKVKEMFPGGNTSQGFFSYYNYIIPPDATRILVIKGGPGVGKSSFMKDIAVEMNNRGFDVELHHCSSDNNSLDGVVFPQIRVAFIDGTSPHIVDPRNPGAVDEIIHLGDFWNEDGIRQWKTEILAINRKVGRLFSRAYRFLKAAKIIHEDLEEINGKDLDQGLANQKAADLIDDIFGGKSVSSKPGNLRKLFISAITPDGFYNHLSTILDPLPVVYGITGAPGTGKSTLIEKIAQAGIERGYHCEAYYCAFEPQKMEHLVIEELGIGLTTAVEPHKYDLQKVTGIINMNECMPTNNVMDTEVRESDLKLIDELFKKALFYISQAKNAHDEMETYYIPHMDFAAINALKQKTLERIFKYAGEQMEAVELVSV